MPKMYILMNICNFSLLNQIYWRFQHLNQCLFLLLAWRHFINKLKNWCPALGPRSTSLSPVPGPGKTQRRLTIWSCKTWRRSLLTLRKVVVQAKQPSLHQVVSNTSLLFQGSKQELLLDSSHSECEGWSRQVAATKASNSVDTWSEPSWSL